MHDQFAFFGHRDELAGRKDAALRMVPAYQRLVTDNPPAGYRKLRLIIENELALVNRLP
jgi:hypothetical protein